MIEPTPLDTIRAALAAATGGPWAPSKISGLNVVTADGQIVTRVAPRRTMADYRRIATLPYPDEQEIDSSMVTEGTVAESMNAANRELIAAAPAWLAELVDRVEAADEAIADMVPRNWHGLMAILDYAYHETTFPTGPDDESRDLGPRIVSLLRRVDSAESVIERVRTLHGHDMFRGHLDNGCSECGHGNDGNGYPCATIRALDGAE